VSSELFEVLRLHLRGRQRWLASMRLGRCDHGACSAKGSLKVSKADFPSVMVRARILHGERARKNYEGVKGKLEHSNRNTRSREGQCKKV
jgi:hypothetical protein